MSAAVVAAVRHEPARVVRVVPSLRAPGAWRVRLSCGHSVLCRAAGLAPGDPWACTACPPVVPRARRLP